MKKIKKLFTVALFCLTLFFVTSINVDANSYVTGGVDIDADFGIQFDCRTTEFFISGASQFNQNYDYIDLSDWNLDTEDLIDEGYQTLVLIFHLEIKEKQDGYQELYVYSNTGSGAASLVSPITSFEHGSGHVDKNYKEYEFYAEINLDDIEDNTIILRYSAHGFLGNKWYNRNLDVQLCASYDTRVYSQLYYTNGI